MPRRALTLAAVVAAVLCAAFAMLAGATFGGLNAVLSNPANGAGSGNLLYQHAYGASTCTAVPVSGSGISTTSAFPCSGSLSPTSPTAASGSVSGPTDTIVNRGSVAAAAQSVGATRCGPVQLADDRNAANPLLARYGITYAPTTGPVTGAGAITLDGAGPGGYATSVLAQTVTAPAGGSGYGYGIWFAASGSAGGPLFAFTDGPANARTTNVGPVLTLSGGRLTFSMQGLLKITSAAGVNYADGRWHFAYAVISAPVATGAVATTASLYVDGAATAVATQASVVNLTALTGYWHAGEAPAADGSPTYFAGSLSDFVVFGSAAAPPTTANLSSQTTFSSWSSGASDRWPLNDTGATTFAGPYPGGRADPCSTVNVVWTFTTPTVPATFTTPAISLAALVGAPQSVGAVPKPATSSTAADRQSAVVSLSRGSGYDAAFDPGLRLYAPLTFTATVGAWSNVFTWSDPAAAFVA